MKIFFSKKLKFFLKSAFFLFILKITTNGLITSFEIVKTFLVIHQPNYPYFLSYIASKQTKEYILF